jgi:hypothetical protein
MSIDWAAMLRGVDLRTGFDASVLFMKTASKLEAR